MYVAIFSKWGRFPSTYLEDRMMRLSLICKDVFIDDLFSTWVQVISSLLILFFTKALSELLLILLSSPDVFRISLFF